MSSTSDQSVILQILFIPFYLVMFIFIVFAYIVVFVPLAILEVIENFWRCKNG